MRDLIGDYDRLQATGEPVGRAVVLSVWGSAPRRPGACMLATRSGVIAGSVSGGCVESATAQEIAAAIDAGTSKVIEFGVSDDTAWDVGLSCGGTLRVLVEPTVRSELLDAVRADEGIVACTVVGGVHPIGASLIVRKPSPGVWVPAVLDDSVADAVVSVTENVTAVALTALASGRSTVTTVTAPDGTEVDVFLEAHLPQPQLVVFGGVHIAEVLVPLATQLGFRTVVADGRAAFLTPERFPTADQLILGWPAEVFQQVHITPATAVCVLTHDPKFDDPAVTEALQSDASYIGVIGSQRTQRARRERLQAAGLSDQLLDRLHGPIGLDLGGSEPREIALAILAQIVQQSHQTAGA